MPNVDALTQLPAQWNDKNCWVECKVDKKDAANNRYTVYKKNEHWGWLPKWAAKLFNKCTKTDLQAARDELKTRISKLTKNDEGIGDVCQRYFTAVKKANIKQDNRQDFIYGISNNIILRLAAIPMSNDDSFQRLSSELQQKLPTGPTTVIQPEQIKTCLDNVMAAIRSGSSGQASPSGDTRQRLSDSSNTLSANLVEEMQPGQIQHCLASVIELRRSGSSSVGPALPTLPNEEIITVGPVSTVGEVQTPDNGTIEPSQDVIQQGELDVAETQELKKGTDNTAPAPVTSATPPVTPAEKEQPPDPPPFDFDYIDDGNLAQSTSTPSDHDPLTPEPSPFYKVDDGYETPPPPPPPPPHALPKATTAKRTDLSEAREREKAIAQAQEQERILASRNALFDQIRTGVTLRHTSSKQEKDFPEKEMPSCISREEMRAFMSQLTTEDEKAKGEEIIKAVADYQRELVACTAGGSTETAISGELKKRRVGIEGEGKDVTEEEATEEEVSAKRVLDALGLHKITNRIEVTTLRDEALQLVRLPSLEEIYQAVKDEGKLVKDYCETLVEEREKKILELKKHADSLIKSAGQEIQQSQDGLATTKVTVTDKIELARKYLNEQIKAEKGKRQDEKKTEACSKGQKHLDLIEKWLNARCKQVQPPRMPTPITKEDLQKWKDEQIAAIDALNTQLKDMLGQTTDQAFIEKCQEKIRDNKKEKIKELHKKITDLGKKYPQNIQNELSNVFDEKQVNNDLILPIEGLDENIVQLEKAISDIKEMDTAQVVQYLLKKVVDDFKGEEVQQMLSELGKKKKQLGDQRQKDPKQEEDLDVCIYAAETVMKTLEDLQSSKEIENCPVSQYEKLKQEKMQEKELVVARWKKELMEKDIGYLRVAIQQFVFPSNQELTGIRQQVDGIKDLIDFNDRFNKINIQVNNLKNRSRNPPTEKTKAIDLLKNNFLPERDLITLKNDIAEVQRIHKGYETEYGKEKEKIESVLAEIQKKAGGIPEGACKKLLVELKKTVCCEKNGLQSDDKSSLTGIIHKALAPEKYGTVEELRTDFEKKTKVLNLCTSSLFMGLPKILQRIGEIGKVSQNLSEMQKKTYIDKSNTYEKFLRKIIGECSTQIEDMNIDWNLQGINEDIVIPEGVVKRFENCATKLKNIYGRIEKFKINDNSIESYESLKVKSLTQLEKIVEQLDKCFPEDRDTISAAEAQKLQELVKTAEEKGTQAEWIKGVINTLLPKLSETDAIEKGYFEKITGNEDIGAIIQKLVVMQQNYRESQNVWGAEIDKDMMQAIDDSIRMLRSYQF